MNKWLFILAAMIVFIVMPAVAEIELGIGVSPPLGQDTSASNMNSANQTGMQQFWNGATKSLHAGWRTLGILYVSGDFVLIPSFFTETMTGSWDSSTATWSPGVYRPAVVSLYDAGFKLKLGSLSLSVQAGLNQLYVYKQSELVNFNAPPLGVNLRLGAGLRLAKFLGLEAVIVTLQPSFQDAVDVVKGVVSSDSVLQQNSLDRLTKQLIPSIQAVLYL
jgi:hypothetical protein